jgi:hypothetical protein
MKYIYTTIAILFYSLSYAQDDKIAQAQQSAISSMSLVDALASRVPGAKKVTDRMGNKNIAIRGRQSFKTAGDEVIWEIDGVIYNSPPMLYANQVKYVEVLNGLAATNKYGSEGGAGVIIVKTSVSAEKLTVGKTYGIDLFKVQKRKKIKKRRRIKKLRNRNFFEI